MISSEILKKIKTLEIKTRKVVNSTFSGEYHSVFKGRGISFSEVREYYLGDDVRLLDWNVTAKMGSPYVKLFEEERELTVMLMVDLSGSGEFGTVEKTKLQIAAEIAGILGFSATKNRDRVGLVLFSDKVERYIPPKKGKTHIFWILRDIFYYQAQSKKTSLTVALDYLLNICKKKAIVFLISDFLDAGYEKKIKIAAKKHDLVPIFLEDPKEAQLPASGILCMEDTETGEIQYVDMRDSALRKAFHHQMALRKQSLNGFFKSIGIHPIQIHCDKPYFEPLAAYFQARAKRY